MFMLMLCLFVKASPQQHRTVIISLDGCRWDYPELYDMPSIDEIGHDGVKAIMKPSFPSVTFPNHYTLATGLVPDHHGIIANTFYDKESGLTFSLGNHETKSNPRFWGGEPIWITAQKQGLKVGVVYWPGSDVKIMGTYPTYYKDYDKKPLLTYSERIVEIERMLKMPKDKRPQLIMAYFDNPDHMGHTFGPESKQTRKSVEELDCLIGQLYHDIKEMPDGKDINLIITSDHGMTRTMNDRIVNIEKLLDKKWFERITYGFPTLVFPKKGCEKKILKALADVPHIHTWEKGKVPAYLSYGTNKNIPSIIVCPDLGWAISSHADVIAGHHGFDPEYGDMQVIFRAVGPDFKHGYVKQDKFRNTSVYPLLAHLLGIIPAKCDGELTPLNDILNK